MRFSKIMVSIVILLNVVFAGVVLYINQMGFVVSDSLVVAWFAFTGTELLSLAYIKSKGDQAGASVVQTGIDELKEHLLGIKDNVDGLKSDVGNIITKQEIKGGDC